MKRKIIFIFYVFIFAAGIAFAQTGEQVEDSFFGRIKQKFEKASQDNKELGEQVKGWVEDDIKKIGDWEYKLVLMDATEDNEKIEQRLNELGLERWNCFWIQPKDAQLIFMFKRPSISYIQKIPKGELLKILNSAQED